jgi:hypothetical protein
MYREMYTEIEYNIHLNTSRSFYGNLQVDVYGKQKSWVMKLFLGKKEEGGKTYSIENYYKVWWLNPIELVGKKHLRNI